MKKKTRRLLTAVLLAVFAVSTALAARDTLRSSREKAANAALAEQVRALEAETPPPPAPESSAPPAPDAPDAEPEEPPSPYAESGVLRQYDPLYEQNGDMAGWLRVDGTAIDYPVMYTPDDVEHYLRRAFDGGYALGGTLFLGAPWSPDAPYAIIFGHHMKDGSMFGGLVDYASADFAAEHPVIRFDTLTERREYEIAAAFYSRVYTNKDANVFRYYQYTDLSDEETFEEYVAQCKAAALYDTGVEPRYGDRLLALSTCSYHTKNGRFVVLARQVAPEE